MTTHLTAVPTPPAEPRAGDHLVGFAVAALATVVGAVLTPFLALAWLGLQPVLPIVLALRARSRSTGATPQAAGRAAA